jgi:hypothetical protein
MESSIERLSEAHCEALGGHFWRQWSANDHVDEHFNRTGQVNLVAYNGPEPQLRGCPVCGRRENQIEDGRWLTLDEIASIKKANGVQGMTEIGRYRDGDHEIIVFKGPKVGESGLFYPPWTTETISPNSVSDGKIGDMTIKGKPFTGPSITFGDQAGSDAQTWQPSDLPGYCTSQ